MALSIEQGFAQRLAQGRIMLGWTLVEQGRGTEGIAQIRQSVAAYGATGADLGRSSYLALLAEAYGRDGRAEEGLTALAGALTAVHEHRICFNEAELYRLQGELLLRQAAGSGGSPIVASAETAKPVVASPPALPPSGRASSDLVEAAEACFRRAIDAARRQGAKSLELRATLDLSRLWQQQGKHEEGQQLLVAIYHWFSEGFDTADLQEAKALLQELEG